MIVLITHNVFIEYQLLQIKKLQFSGPTNNVHLSIKIDHLNKVKLLYLLPPFRQKLFISCDFSVLVFLDDIVEILSSKHNKTVFINIHGKISAS